MVNRRARIRRRRCALFEQQGGLCYWCKGEAVLMDGQTFHGVGQPKNLATLDHLRDRYDPTRREPSKGEPRYVMACYDCKGIELTMQIARHTESPIETMLAVAILRQWQDIEFRTYDAGPARGWTLIPQYPWGKYRVDLALRKPDGFLIFIECDGKDFHSSPEQIERDLVREQLMVDAGYPVVRFTGADINYSPVACANQLRCFRRWGT